MAGFVAENILSNNVEIITWRDVANLPADTICVDVRNPLEYSLGSIPGFINIPLDELREHLSELPKDKTIVLSCAVGLRGYLACRILMTALRTSAFFVMSAPIRMPHSEYLFETESISTTFCSIPSRWQAEI